MGGKRNRHVETDARGVRGERSESGEEEQGGNISVPKGDAENRGGLCTET